MFRLVESAFTKEKALASFTQMIFGIGKVNIELDLVASSCVTQLGEMNVKVENTESYNL